MAKKNTTVDANGITNETFTPDMLPKNATKLPKPKAVKAEAAAPVKTKTAPKAKVAPKVAEAAAPKVASTKVVPIAKGKKVVAVAPPVAAPSKKGKTAAVVTPIAGKRGRKPKELTHTLKDVMAFVKQGYSLAQIAEEIGVTIPTLYNRFPEIKGAIPKGRRKAA